MKKRGYDLNLIDEAVTMLSEGKFTPSKCIQMSTTNKAS
ncbi:MAG: type II toxin-antitoxin system YafQ family toxin [Eubacteriaceae bacterium]|nr:type II toxin-antitoxin system YafQ family toxin [Eubacteriaceae bacterium]